YFLDADNVTFNASGKQGTVTVDATGVKPDNMYVTAGDYTFEGGAITATGDITISGGKATFDTDFGATTVTVGSAATLGVTNPHTLTGDLNASGATLNFTAPLNAPSGTKILSVTGNATIPNTSVNVAIPGTASPLQIGDFLVLIDAAGSLVGKPLTTVASALGMQGVTIDYEFALSTTAKQLIATLQESPAANPQSKSLSEGFVSGVAVITETSDFTANEGMSAAVDAVGHDTTAIDYKAFGAVGGGNIRYNTGSHVDLKSFSAVAGIAKGFSLKKSYLTLGAFFEYGSGSYDTYNSFSGVAFHGDGDITHIGGGILGKAEFNRTDRGQGYFEGSVRAGEVKNTYTNKDMNVGGVNASYKAKSSYAGFHLGTGYIFAVNPKADLDLYTKYYFTRQGKDDVTLTTGDPIHFDAVKSSRVRVGARLSGKGKVVSPYIGAAIEREFDGQAKATAFGLPIDAPSLKGNTGIGELGLTLRPAKAPGLSINLGLQGYVGKREGVSGSFRLRYEF
ncbi:MAG: autotransporter outer membrane beta-barrel domain-containing protein, partial [Fusobacteriaceae bacterium]|nr:autotransporter outer membrane beta-barrel domain-containing protein [Fusobacteriaceae bacterium]